MAKSKFDPEPKYAYYDHNTGDFVKGLTKPQLFEYLGDAIACSGSDVSDFEVYRDKPIEIVETVMLNFGANGDE